MRHPRSAFTLIEMVAASAIAALLMAGAFIVMTTMIHDRQRMKMSESSGREKTLALVEIIRRDLSAASTYEAGKNRMIMRSYRLLDKDFVSMDRPVQVQYQMARGDQGDGGNLLIRRQQAMDDPTVPRPARALLAIGIQDWKIEPLPDDTMPEATPTDGANNKPLAPPRRFRLQMHFDDARDNVDQVICLR
jgi:prepilin-type N-terminal cleavage/methylation domain-containing protein